MNELRKWIRLCEMTAEAEYLYHGGPCDLPNNRPSGNGFYHFGDKTFFAELTGTFGGCTYVYHAPPDLSQRILEIGVNDDPPVKFLNAAVRVAISKKLWGNARKPPREWDEETLDDYFSEIVTNAADSGLPEVIRQFGLYGVKFNGEYILLQDGIDKLEFVEKIEATEQQTQGTKHAAIQSVPLSDQIVVANKIATLLRQRYAQVKVVPGNDRVWITAYNTEIAPEHEGETHIALELTSNKRVHWYNFNVDHEAVLAILRRVAPDWDKLMTNFPDAWKKYLSK